MTKNEPEGYACYLKILTMNNLPYNDLVSCLSYLLNLVFPQIAVSCLLYSMCLGYFRHRSALSCSDLIEGDIKTKKKHKSKSYKILQAMGSSQENI